MNQLVILFAIVVGFTYFGGTSVPKMLKDKQQVLLGVLVGLMIGQMNLVEGAWFGKNTCKNDSECINTAWRNDEMRGSDGECCHTKVKCGDGDHWAKLGGVSCYYDDAENCSLDESSTTDATCKKN